MKKFCEEYYCYVVTLILAILLTVFVISPVDVSGISMEPTIKNNEFTYHLKQEKVKRFDIITFKMASDLVFIKRVIGMPGDLVEYHGGELFINGDPFKETYLGEPFTESYSFVVPEKHYFVLGDNRKNSADSRNFGFINDEQIIGVIHKIFS